jgi:hypothetical protein
MNDFLPVIMSQVLSNNFHIRTFVEAILIKLYTDMTESANVTNNGLNDPKFIENKETKILFRQIYSVVKSVIDEYNIFLKSRICFYIFKFFKIMLQQRKACQDCIKSFLFSI